MPLFRGSLYQRLVVPLSGFVLVTSLALVVWISHSYRQDSLRRFGRMAETNAGFVDELPLPRSSEMAGKLSAILGVTVGFRGAEGELARSSAEGWPPNVEALLTDVAGPEEVTLQADRFELAIAPLGESGAHLILVRSLEGGWRGMGGRVLAPALGLTVACGCLVFVLAHRIVRPLTILTGWLPQLNHEAEQIDPVPPVVSERRDEIGVLARSLEETHQRLDREQERRRNSERMATLGQIATRLAHEVRNPAAAIRMHADVLAHSEGSPDKESIDLIREEVERITDLVNQWLFVARAEPPEKRRHDLVEATESVARRLGPALAHAGTSLTIDAPGPAVIDCDRLRIEQVVRNLIVNAMQAMPRGGEIKVEVRAGDQDVKMRVRDSGAGFSEVALRRFGEAFFSEREGGMGIGLTLAREVVEAHGGTIRGANRVQGGAEVSVSLPRSELRTVS